MPITESIEVWIETPAPWDHVPTGLRKLRIKGTTLVPATHPLTQPVGVFRSEGGQFVIFQEDRKLLGDPHMSLGSALGSTSLDQARQARIRLLCEWPDDPATQKRLFDESILAPDQIRELRLPKINAEEW